MLSWAFRNRARLQAVYGLVPPPELAGARFAGPPAPAGRAARAPLGGTWRRGRSVWLRPAARRAAGPRERR